MDTKYSLEFTVEARQQYIEIINYYIEFESVDKALKVERSFTKMYSKIAESPFVFTMYEASGKPDKNKRRAVVHGTFIIVFLISTISILIVDIYHVSRNPSNHSISKDEL